MSSIDLLTLYFIDMHLHVSIYQANANFGPVSVIIIIERILFAFFFLSISWIDICDKIWNKLLKLIQIDWNCDEFSPLINHIVTHFVSQFQFVFDTLKTIKFGSDASRKKNEEKKGGKSVIIYDIICERVSFSAYTTQIRLSKISNVPFRGAALFSFHFSRFSLVNQCVSFVLDLLLNWHC